MSSNAASPSFAASPGLAGRPWWQLALLAAVSAAVANLVVFFVAEAAGLRLRAPNQQTGGLMDLPPAFVAFLSALPAVVAALLAAGLARWAAPRRWFVAAAGVVLLLSFLPVLTAPVPTGTKLVLGLMHVVAAAAIVPPLAARLGRSAR